MEESSNIVGSGALGQALRSFVPQDCQTVFFCVKAFSLVDALVTQHKLWSPSVPFITLSNGYIEPVVREFCESHPERIVRVGMTTLAATINSDGHLQTYAEGAVTVWGCLDGRDKSPTSDEASLIEKNPGWAWAAKDALRSQLRRKWIFNTVLNTLCGALRLSNNGLLSNHRSLADDVFDEAYGLSGELWPVSVPIERKDELNRLFWQLVTKTGQNENSMMRDVRLHRRTETDYLAGQAINRAGYEKLKSFHTLLKRFG